MNRKDIQKLHHGTIPYRQCENCGMKKYGITITMKDDGFMGSEHETKIAKCCGHPKYNWHKDDDIYTTKHIMRYV